MPEFLPPTPHSDDVGTVFGAHMIPAAANPGLVFDRYFRIWEEPGRRRSPPIDPLREFVEDYHTGQNEESRRLLDETHKRLDQLVQSSQGVTGEFVTRARLAIGLGIDHPLENGFVFDRSLGVPYLPGSSIKGLCRAWAHLADVVDEEIHQVFGTGPTETEELGIDERRGDVVFLPAFPKSWPKLEIDIVNNHHPGYYRETRNRARHSTTAPLDLESPVPVYFLTIAPQTRFVFRIAPSHPSVPATVVERSREFLKQGLRFLGVGAKTAVGYGVFLVES